MKRFYRRAASAECEGGYTVTLDGKPIRTPGKAAFVVPNSKLARAAAREWQDQGETIDPHAMVFMRLASTAIDRVAPRRAEIIDEIAAYGANDLLCYRAEPPSDLARRQDAVWQPLLDWAEARYGARLEPTVSVRHHQQPGAAVAALRTAVAAHDNLALAALYSLVTAAGSLVIGLALATGEIDARAAFEAAALEELFQMERWGEDDDMVRRQRALRDDLAAGAKFLVLARA